MKIFDCPHCQKLLALYQQSHGGKEFFLVKLPYNCEQCGKEFVPAKSRNRAMRFCCAKCRVQFQNDKNCAKTRRSIRRIRAVPLVPELGPRFGHPIPKHEFEGNLVPDQHTNAFTPAGSKGCKAIDPSVTVQHAKTRSI